MSPLPVAKPLIGVIHLPALPGAPRHRDPVAALVDGAARDAAALAQAGFDAVLVENFGDVPFFRGAVPVETVSVMAVIADAVRRAAGLPVGVNVLRNDGASALAVALAAQADFIRVNVTVAARVTDQGVVQSEAAALMRKRSALGAVKIALAADVDVKHSAALAPSPIDEEAREAVERALADVLVVTGSRTGTEADRDALLAVKSAVDVPVWLGSGVRRESLRRWLEVADGAIVGSALRRDGRAGGPIDLETARAFAGARG